MCSATKGVTPASKRATEVTRRSSALSPATEALPKAIAGNRENSKAAVRNNDAAELDME
jgi:hypothetical protein